MDMLPDNDYFHAMFGSDKEKCPDWFSVLFGLSMVVVYGTIGVVLILAFVF